MANVFKVITKSDVGLVGSQTTLLTVPSAKTEIVLSLLLANKHTTSIKATVILSSDTTQTGGGASNADVYIIKDANINAENSLERKVICQDMVGLSQFDEYSNAPLVEYHS